VKRMARAAVLSALRDKLDDHGSWAGETHIQKSAFFLQEAALVPLGYDFILYKHGPFSFDLRDDLSGFRADGLLALMAQAPYGPRLVATEQGTSLQNRFPKTLKRYSPQIDQVATFIGSRGVGELERLGTALLLVKENPDWDDNRLSAEMCRLKPHVSASQALSAVTRVKEFLGNLVTAESP
jgi:uncharacterized protein YwgA